MVDAKKVVLVVVAVGAFFIMSASNGGNSWIKVLDKNEVLGIITSWFGLWNHCGNYWLTIQSRTSDKIVSWSGLWNSCTKYECKPYPFDEVKDKLHATRAFTTIGTLLCTAGAIIALVRLCKDVDGKIPAGLLIGAGWCMVIGLAIYTDFRSGVVKSDYVSYGWSYILGWIASILAFVAGALHIVLK